MNVAVQAAPHCASVCPVVADNAFDSAPALSVGAAVTVTFTVSVTGMHGEAVHCSCTDPECGPTARLPALIVSVRLAGAVMLVGACRKVPPLATETLTFAVPVFIVDSATLVMVDWPAVTVTGTVFGVAIRSTPVTLMLTLIVTFAHVLPLSHASVIVPE